jgi:hypothetical protein
LSVSLPFTNVRRATEMIEERESSDPGAVRVVSTINVHSDYERVPGGRGACITRVGCTSRFAMISIMPATVSAGVTPTTETRSSLLYNPR